MRLDWAILANSAEVREGLAYMLGGGIDTVNSSQLPAPLFGSLLLRLLLHRTEADREHTLELRFLGEDGQEVAPRLTANFQVPVIPSPEDVPIGWDLPVMFAFNIQGLQLPTESRYSIEVLADGIHLKSLNLRARIVRPPTPPPST